MSNDTSVLDGIGISEWVGAYAYRPLRLDDANANQLAAPDEKRWVNWRFETREDKKTKVLCMPNGRNAKSNDSSTWRTFSETVAAQDRFDGVGIVFDGTMLGIDLDHCIENEALLPEVEAFVDKAETYVEISPSGTGLHVILKLAASLKLERNRSGNYECYTENRYFTFTSNPWTASFPVRTVTPDEAEELLRLLGYPWKEKERPLPVPQRDGTTTDDAELLKKMFSSKHGAKIKALYDGDISQHGDDDSAADAALCSHLAYWTDGDAVRVLSMWRASPLGTRSKTQERTDYQKLTVDFAMRSYEQTRNVPAPASMPLKTGLRDQSSLPPLTVISAAELMAMDVKVEWLIDSLFTKGTPNMISAPPHKFKSTLALRMAICVANGTPLFDEFEVSERMNVLVINEEDGHALIKEQCEMLLQDGESLDGISFSIDTTRKIGDASWVRDVVEKAKARDVGFVILDSLRALHNENENDSQAMQMVMNHIKLLTLEKLTVLFTHHDKKWQQGNADDRSERGMDMVRGSSAIPAAIHGHISIEEKRTGGHYLVIHQHKLKATTKRLDPFVVNIGEILEPRRMSLTYGGPYDADTAASDMMEERLMSRFKEHPQQFFTRGRFVELQFAKSEGDKTLRASLSSLERKQMIRRKKFSDLSDAERGCVFGAEGKTPSHNAAVYWFVSDALVEVHENETGTDINPDEVPF